MHTQKNPQIRPRLQNGMFYRIAKSMSSVATQHRSKSPLRALAWRLPVLSGFWWIISEGRPESWWVGAPLIVAMSLLSVFAHSESVQLKTQFEWGGHVRTMAVPRFVGYFVAQSLRGGFDVALRALRPSMPLSLGFIRYSWRLPVCDARWLLINTVSLLPGTLSVEFSDDALLVHVLDTRLDVIRDVEELEARIAAMFGLPLATQAPTTPPQAAA